MSNNTAVQPAGSADVHPAQLNLHDVLKALTVALAKLPGADGLLIGKAHVALESKHGEGFRKGKEAGFREGFDQGYNDGLEDGKREALAHEAAEEAERATLKASAKARRVS